MDKQLKAEKPIDELELFEYTYLYSENKRDDLEYESIITRVHGGYLYAHWYSGVTTFIPYNGFYKDIKRV